MNTVPEYDSSLSEKHYPEHIVNIVDQISQLTLVETAELNELLKVLVGHMGWGRVEIAVCNSDVAPTWNPHWGERTEGRVRQLTPCKTFYLVVQSSGEGGKGV